MVSSQDTAPMFSASTAPWASNSSTFCKSSPMLKPPPLADVAGKIYRPDRSVVDPQGRRVCTHPREWRAVAQKRRAMLAGVHTLLAWRLIVFQGQSASHINPSSTTAPASTPRPLYSQSSNRASIMRHPRTPACSALPARTGSRWAQGWCRRLRGEPESCAPRHAGLYGR